MIDFVVDLETTANGPDNSPEAHWPSNRVLLWGHSVAGHMNVYDTCQNLKADLMNAHRDGEQIIIIGHNLKFDLKYMIRDMPDIPWHKFDYICTMHKHYRWSGHKDKFISLTDLAAIHNITFTKTLDLGALIKSGVKMEDIPRSDLEPYLVEDVEVTKMIAFEQGRVDPVTLSNHVLPLGHMELLGLPLDRTLATKAMTALVTDEGLLAMQMEDHLRKVFEWDNGDPLLPNEIKFNAPRTLSLLLTNKPVTGIVKGKKRLVWKAGMKPTLTGAQITGLWPGKTPTNLGYPMPLAKLKDIQALIPHYSYIQWVMDYRKVQKLMGTYIGPFLERTKTIPTIHPKMHMVSTATGRLSSAEPNGQNLPPNARELFESQYGNFHEIDFKQLEVCALAAITQDQQLIDDINDGVDSHFETGKQVMGWKVETDQTKEERTLVKNVNFGLIYGGGAGGLSMQTGQPKKLIKSLMDGFFKRYPQVAVWQENFYKDVVKVLKPYDVKDGEQRYHSMVTLPISSRKFHFVESESPKWLKAKTGRKYSFKPTETKNYPVQGFAGGDIVMLALTELHRKLWDEHNTEIRMTVHDSILVDTGMPVNELRTIMEDVCTQIETVFSLPFELKFDITSGDHWR